MCSKAQCTVVPGTVPTSFIDVPPNEKALLEAVAEHGPLSVAIEADQSVFQFYKSGVLTGACGTHLNHGVLLVGYGRDPVTGLTFWKVKNSWVRRPSAPRVHLTRWKRAPRGARRALCASSAASAGPRAASAASPPRRATPCCKIKARVRVAGLRVLKVCAREVWSGFLIF